ncbi:MAG: zinc-regulated TonB-dependent outer membrane receptor [Polyangiaceae bacterium]|nr:zinc-regulated TonB-dependent outer membrane receptor [Polyangiaceae bacterium]
MPYISRGRAPLLAVTILFPISTAAAQDPASPASEPANGTGPPAPSSGFAPARTDAASGAESFDELELMVATEPGAPPSGSPRDSAPPLVTGGGLASALNPAISAILDVAFAYFSEDEPLQAGHHDPKRTGFNWQGLELSLSGSVDPYLRFDAHLGFCHEGAAVEEAYATTLALPGGLQARFGKFLTRFGRLNSTHMHTWNFADQPFELSRLFGGEGERGLGAEVSVVLPLPWSVELVGSATEAHGEGSTRSFLDEEERPMESFLDPLYTTAIKQFFALSNDWSLVWGLSANFGPNASSDDHRTEIYGTDLYLKFRPLHRPEPRVVSLHSEWFYRRRELPGVVLRDYGQFTEVLWRFARRWATAARYELGSPAFDAEGTVLSDPLDPEWMDTRHRTSTSVSFYPTEFSRFRWQWGSDLPHPHQAIWSTFFTAEVSLGAHGAHAF